MAGDLRICADGGANRLFDRVEESKQSMLECPPNIICGDLDSIRSEVRAHYSGSGVTIKDLSSDQDSTDLDKCLYAAQDVLKEREISIEDSTLLVVGQWAPVCCSALVWICIMLILQ